MNPPTRSPVTPKLGRPLEFLDTQNNGVGLKDRTIIDFSRAGLTHEMLRKAVDRWAIFGTRVLMPTVITSPKKTYTSNLPVIGEAIRTWGKDSLGPLYLEGPGISRKDCARGAHPRANCHRLKIEEFDEWDELSDHTIGLITLAPEWPGACEFISYVTKKGVVVSLGHHDADPGRVREAIAAGARGSTHVGNGCAAQLHRHDVLLWQQILHPQLACCFITDGHHIGSEFARLAIRAKWGIDPRLPIIVSDASPAAKAPPGFYPIFNGKGVRVRKDGAVVVPGQRPVKFAGSGSSLMECMQGALDLGFDSEQVMRMARENPWEFIREPLQRRLGRTPEDYSVPRPGVPQIDLIDGRFKLVSA